MSRRAAKARASTHPLQRRADACDGEAGAPLLLPKVAAGSHVLVARHLVRVVRLLQRGGAPATAGGIREQRSGAERVSVVLQQRGAGLSCAGGAASGCTARGLVEGLGCRRDAGGVGPVGLVLQTVAAALYGPADPVSDGHYAI